MTNYDSPGDVLTLTAPIGGVVKGGAYLIGSLVVIAAVSADAGDKFAAQTRGVFTVVKKGDSAWTEGEKVYWDDGETNFQDSSGGNILVGVAAESATQAATTGKVRLDGVVR